MGIVEAIGSEVVDFTVGDSVYYAGALNRQGSNAEYQCVDARIAAKKPKNLSNAEAAAVPLTALTAWEMAFEHLQLAEKAEASDEVLLIVGAAGGVGSILIQLVKALSSAKIIATASRPETTEWVKSLGADYVIDHSKDLMPQIEALGISSISHVASLNGTATYYDDYIAMLRPFGKLAIIDDPSEPLDVMKLKQKSLSFHIEFMFARSMFQTADQYKQGQILAKLAELLDEGVVRSTLSENLGTINASNLTRGHQQLLTSAVIGKLVCEGF